MSIEYFISRVWRISSLIGLGITLLFIYRGLPDPAAVHFGETGRGDGFLPKDQIFYLIALVITVLNVLSLLLIKTVARIPTISFTRLLAIFHSENGEDLQKSLINWLHFLPAIINTFLILVLRTLLLLNDSRTYSQDFSYIFWVGGLLILIWLVYLPFRLFSLPKLTEEL